MGTTVDTQTMTVVGLFKDFGPSFMFLIVDGVFRILVLSTNTWCWAGDSVGYFWFTMDTPSPLGGRTSCLIACERRHSATARAVYGDCLDRSLSSRPIRQRR